MKHKYPECKTVDVTKDWFNTKLIDPYAWMHNKKDPEVLEFVKQENAFTDQFFPLERLQRKQAQLKSERPKSLPTSLEPWNDSYIASVINDGKITVEILDRCFNKTGTIPEIFDLEGVDVFSAIPSPNDSNLLGIMYQVFGAARPSISVFDVKQRKSIFTMPMNFNFCWSKISQKIYFTATKTEGEDSITGFYSYDVYKNELNKIYEYDGYSIFGHVHASNNGRFIIVEFCKDYSDSLWFSFDTVTDNITSLTSSPKEWEYIDSIDSEHYFISMTDADYGEVIKVSDSMKKETILPESELVLEHGFAIGSDLYVCAKQDVSSRLINVSTGNNMTLPSNMGTLEVIGQQDSTVFLRFESFIDAPILLTFNGSTITPLLRSSDAVYSDLIVEQGFAPSSADGKKIPYYLVRKKDAIADSTAPVLMYGYGGYNSGMTPWYQDMVSGVTIPKWVEAGGIYVHCNLRGGNEYGPKWHEDGMMMKKRHCFEDFIGIAEKIIKDGWTSKGKIGISGCSNGGLLVSALLTMRPDLWGCAIDSVPHTDMIHFVEDDRGPMYITEYGDPRESKEMFEYLLQYSPYHNIKESYYPPVYIQTGENDNNVPPYHGKKFAARLQTANLSDNPILLRVLADGSHDRGKGDSYWKTISEMHLFLEDALLNK